MPGTGWSASCCHRAYIPHETCDFPDIRRRRRREMLKIRSRQNHNPGGRILCSSSERRDYADRHAAGSHLRLGSEGSFLLREGWRSRRSFRHWGKRCSCITRTDAVKIRIAGTQCDRKFIPVCFRMVGPFLTFKSNFLNGRSNRKQGERES